MIVETDVCAEGWGGILKCRPYKDAPKSIERICRFASGVIRRKASTIDCEILAIIYSLDKFRLFLVDKKKFIVRTDCVSIVKFSNKVKHNSKKKISNARWIDFLEILAIENYHVTFEHIKGEKNTLGHFLSRQAYPQVYNHVKALIADGASLDI